MAVKRTCAKSFDPAWLHTTGELLIAANLAIKETFAWLDSYAILLCLFVEKTVQLINLLFYTPYFNLTYNE